MAYNGGIEDHSFCVSYGDEIGDRENGTHTAARRIDETTNIQFEPHDGDGDLDGDPTLITVGEVFTISFDYEGETYSFDATVIRSDPTNIVFLGEIDGQPVEVNVSPGYDLNAAPDQYARDDIRKAKGEIPCFIEGTLIAVAGGRVRAIERLEQGDLVRTADGSVRAIVWVGRRYLTRGELKAAPELRPIRIIAGALGRGLPERDLLVSPQHRMLVSSKIVRRMFDVPDVLVAAKHLVGLPGISVATDMAEVTYFHVLCEDHEVLLANGAPTESLLMGPETKAMIGDEALGSFPKRVMGKGFAELPARLIPQGKRRKQLVMRHEKNDKPLLEQYALAALSKASEAASA